ncbi:MAG: RluA family pseudouridine synthase [Chloroflexota bacterium]
MTKGSPEDINASSNNLDLDVLNLTVSNPGYRLDQELSDQIQDVSRSQIQKWIKTGLVQVNGQVVVKPNRRLEGNEEIAVSIPEPKAQPLAAEPMDLDIVFECDDLVVVNKPAGLVVHPGAGHSGGTLINGLIARYPQLATVTGTRRPGIVHRLDKGTSGLMVVALTERALLNLKKQFQDRRVEKVYITLLEGGLTDDEGVIHAPIGRSRRDRKRMAVVSGARPASTAFRVLERLENYTLAVAFPLTGRTHQIRVHFSSRGQPLMGDKTYGRRKQRTSLKRPFLHAFRLAFSMPETGENVSFTAPIPNDLLHQIRLLNSEWTEVLGNAILNPDQIRVGKWWLAPELGETGGTNGLY